MCLLRPGAGVCLGMGKEFRGGCVRGSGQESSPARFAGRHPPPSRHRRGGWGRVLAAELQAWGLRGSVLGEPVRPRHAGQGEGAETPRLGTRTGAQPQAAAGGCGAPFRGSGYRRPQGRSSARQAGVSAGVPVGCRGPGRPRPAGPVPGATRARPRGHPCYYPAPRRGDPSAAAAPHRPGPPAWRPPGGGRGGPAVAASGGLRGSPSPPGPRRASSAATATAASALPAWLWH